MIETCAPPAAAVARIDDALVIRWEDGEQGVFSHRWLKAHSRYGSFPSLIEAPNPFGDDPGPLNPWSVCIEYDETLVVSWSGLKEVSRFSLEELRNSLPVVACRELALAAD